MAASAAVTVAASGTPAAALTSASAASCSSVRDSGELRADSTRRSRMRHFGFNDPGGAPRMVVLAGLFLVPDGLGTNATHCAACTSQFVLDPL